MRRKQIDISEGHNVALNGSLLIVGTTILLCFLFFITTFLYIRLEQNKKLTIKNTGIEGIYADEKKSIGERNNFNSIIPLGPANKIL